MAKSSLYVCFFSLYCLLLNSVSQNRWSLLLRSKASSTSDIRYSTRLKYLKLERLKWSQYSKIATSLLGVRCHPLCHLRNLPRSSGIENFPLPQDTFIVSTIHSKNKINIVEIRKQLKINIQLVTTCVSQSLSDMHLGAAITGSLLVSRRIWGDQSHASLVHSLLDKHPGIIPHHGSCTRYNARNYASPTTLPAPLGVRVFLSSD